MPDEPEGAAELRSGREQPFALERARCDADVEDPPSVSSLIAQNSPLPSVFRRRSTDSTTPCANTCAVTACPGSKTNVPDGISDRDANPRNAGTPVSSDAAASSWDASNASSSATPPAFAERGECHLSLVAEGDQRTSRSPPSGPPPRVDLTDCFCCQETSLGSGGRHGSRLRAPRMEVRWPTTRSSP